MCSSLIALLAHPFVSFHIIPSLLVAGGSTSRYSYYFLSEKLAVRCESESYSSEQIEGLTAKVFGGDFELVRTIWSF